MIHALIANWVFHPLRGLGYQLWSGIASDVSEVTLVLGIGGWAIHHNCRKRGCPRLGHPHPDHGRPVCGRHFHDADVAPPKP